MTDDFFGNRPYDQVMPSAVAVAGDDDEVRLRLLGVFHNLFSGAAVSDDRPGLDFLRDFIFDESRQPVFGVLLEKNFVFGDLEGILGIDRLRRQYRQDVNDLDFRPVKAGQVNGYGEAQERRFAEINRTEDFFDGQHRRLLFIPAPQAAQPS
jgi:hypothetical protein